MLEPKLWTSRELLASPRTARDAQTQNDGRAMPVASAGAGVGDVGAENVDRQGAAGFPQERIELPVQNYCHLKPPHKN